MLARRFMLVVAIAATLAGVGALVLLATRPGPERLPPDADLGALFADYGCPGCNVLLITVDTLRADHLPCLGYPKDTAPNICAFGERNLLFTNAVSSAPSTVPALVGMFSGSIVSNEDPAELLAHHRRLPTLAEELRRRGYLTAGFTDHPALLRAGDAGNHLDYLRRGFDLATGLDSSADSRTSEELSDAVIAWLEEHRGGKLFAWAHYADPRWDYVPPPELARRFGFDEQTCGDIEIGIDLADVRKIEKALTNEEIACLVALHQAEVCHADRHIGRVLDRLDSLGLSDDTLVVITAAHGEEFFDRDRLGNEKTVYQELMHVPLVVRNPKRFVAGHLTANISTSSVYRIVVGAVTDGRVELPGDVVGRAYHYYDRGTDDVSEYQRLPNEFAIWVDQTKLILTPRTGRYELYDLAADPRERHNLGVKAAKASPLYGRLRSWIEASSASPAPPPRPSAP